MEAEAAEARAVNASTEALIAHLKLEIEKLRRALQFSHKSPVFIALDPSDKGPAPKVTSGLKTRAKWRISVPLDAAPVDKHVAFAGSFVERVKREFAELTGVDVCKVIVEFRIIA